MDDKAFNLIDKSFDKTKLLLDQAGNNMLDIPEPNATLLLVYGAQGIIDNGGYEYFFSKDWINNPNYQFFIDAYNRIGCNDQAQDLQRVVNSFPFKEPHLHVDLRRKYISDNYNPDNFEIAGWSDNLCGDNTVWEKLAEYIEKNERYFS